MKKSWISLLLLISVAYRTQSYKILGLFTHIGYSHFIVMRPLMEELARRGHEVTVVSHFPVEKPISGYKDISLAGTLPIHVELLSLEDLYNLSRFQLYRTPLDLENLAETICEAIYNSTRLDKLIRSTDKFDLIITEMFNTDCFLPLNVKFNAPVIGISSCSLLPWLYDRFGIPNNPSYVPNGFMDYSKNLNFFQRLENTLLSWVDRLYYFNWRNENDDRIARRFFPEKIPHVSKFVDNSSLMLVNTHFSLTNAMPYPPNVIEVGGIHLPPNHKPLPENIKKFIEESPEGVIFFSLGSMVRSDTLPLQKREEFLRTFARLPQRVLWKWENETLPGKPENVMIKSWMSQFDILSHPNVVAFIGHGGLLGIIEAVHNGVPMLVMPHRGDQYANAKVVEDNDGGIVLYLEDATEERLFQSLQTILHPEFRAKAKALSERFRDRPMSPMDTAVYWVEYVVRHKGAPHMRTSVVDMPFYQYLLLDVFSFLAVFIVLISFISYKITKVLLRIVFRGRKLKQN